VPEENFWTLWCKGRLTEADTLTIRLGVTPSGLTSAQPPPSPQTSGSITEKKKKQNAVKKTNLQLHKKYIVNINLCR